MIRQFVLILFISFLVTEGLFSLGTPVLESTEHPDLNYEQKTFSNSLKLLACSVGDITFRVNMNEKIDQGIFDPQINFVDVAGSFNNWDDQNLHIDVLTDPDVDGIYEITLTGFIPTEEIQFKFRIDGSWDDATAEFPMGEPNRIHTVINDCDIREYWYNDEVFADCVFNPVFSTDLKKVYENSLVHFSNESTGSFDNVSWYFEGGSPANSNEHEPLISFPMNGTFDVTLNLNAEGCFEVSTFMEDYITISPQDKNQLDWWNDLVFYEIFVRSFYDSNGDGIGDFQGLIQKLDYLNDGDPNTDTDLGIEGIWLMPINNSPSYHGYDVTDYKGINPEYGTLQDFKDFLAAAHARGIRVIIDYVMNHSSLQHPWFLDSETGPAADKRSWYRWSDTHPGYQGPWGQDVWHSHSSGKYYYGLFWNQMPDLNYDEPDVKTAMFDIAEYWLDEIGIDGFRLDAVKYMYEDGTQLENTVATHQFWKDYQTAVKSYKSDAFSVGEAWTSTAEIQPYVNGGGLDACFEFDLAGNIGIASNDETAGGLQKSMQNVYNAYPYLQFASFVRNHDMNRMYSDFGGDIDHLKNAAGLLLTLPGIPFIYYGDEVGMKNGDVPDVFDENKRTPMQWTPGAKAGFTSGIPWFTINDNFATYNVQTMDATPTSLLNWYKKIIKIRNDNPVFQTGDYRPVYTNNDKVFAFERRLEGVSILVIVNLGAPVLNNIELNLNYSFLTSQYCQFLNLCTMQHEQLTINEAGLISGIQLQPYEFKILKSYPLNINHPQGKTLMDPLYQAHTQITSSGKIPTGYTVKFVAEESISLLDQFEVEQGSTFEVMLQGCEQE